MPEPISMGIGLLLWEYAVKPVIDSAKKEYGENIKEKLKGSVQIALSKLPFKKDELKVIEIEVIEIDDSFCLIKKTF